MVFRKIVDAIDDAIGSMVMAIGVPAEHAEKVKIAIEVVFVAVVVLSVIS